MINQEHIDNINDLPTNIDNNNNNNNNNNDNNNNNNRSRKKCSIVKERLIKFIIFAEI